MQFIFESNRILQVLQSDGENAGKVFDYIRRFAYFASSCRRENYKTNIEKIVLHVFTGPTYIELHDVY